MQQFLNKVRRIIEVLEESTTYAGRVELYIGLLTNLVGRDLHKKLWCYYCKQ